MSNIDCLQTVCGVSKERANELLEAANGSLERAVDIFFHQKQQGEESAHNNIKQSDTLIAQGANKKRKSEISSLTPSKEVELLKKARITLDSPVLSISSGAKHGQRCQAKLNSFFAKRGERSDDEVCPKKKLIKHATLAKRDEDDEVEAVECSVSIQPLAFESNWKRELDRSDPKTNTSKESAELEIKSDEMLVQCEVTFQQLSATLQEMSATTKRNLKLKALEAFIRNVLRDNRAEAPKIITCAIELVLGRRSHNDQTPLDVSGSAVSKALQATLGVSKSQLSKGYRKFGDLGDSAALYFQKQTSFFVSKSPPLLVVSLYETMGRMALTKGRDAKQHTLMQLIRSCQSKTELRFLIRLLIGNMRVGANLKSCLASLAMATAEDGSPCKTVLESRAAIQMVQKTHDICPDLEKITRALLRGGLQQMRKECDIEVLTPIAPMLANAVHSLEEIQNAMEGRQKSKQETKENIYSSRAVVLEYKYDGVRCQAHYDGTTVKLFSRHLLNSTSQYPDAVQSVMNARKLPSVQSFILDSEIVAVEEESANKEGDNQGGKTRLLPFQDLSRRKRKSENGDEIRVKIFAFDLMYLNGTSLINRPLRERQQALRDHFQETDDFAFVSSKSLQKFEENSITSFLEEAVTYGAEGLMVKILGDEKISRNHKNASTEIGQSPYEAGTRSNTWFKVKKDYVAGYADTIDVVPIGAWYGNGRKAQKSFLSPVLLAVYDDEDDVFRSISRCMSFTDEMYEAMRNFYFHGTQYPCHVGIEESSEAANTNTKINESMTSETSNAGKAELEKSIEDVGDREEQVNCYSNRPSSALFVTNESPPIWFKPLEVFEVSFADITLSRQHTAAAGLVEDNEGRGVALRFPRFKRRRPDKTPEQATTCSQIAQLFFAQSKQASFSTTKM